MLTERERRLRAQLGGLSNAAKPGYDGRVATAPAFAARRAKYAAEVDPESRLGPADLEAAINRAWQRDMVAGKLKRATERRKRARRRAG